MVSIRLRQSSMKQHIMKLPAVRSQARGSEIDTNQESTPKHTNRNLRCVHKGLTRHVSVAVYLGAFSMVVP